MPPAPFPENEASRLACLRGLGVLDTPAETRYDDLTALAAEVAQTPIAVVSLVDANRQWFKSKYGLEVCETGRDEAFCSYTILHDTALIVPDATKDPRFCDSPLVVGEPAIRAYAGFPLKMPDGHMLGTLCVIDLVPRAFSEIQIKQLSRLADFVVSLLQGSRREQELQTAHERNAEVVRVLRKQKLQLSLLNEQIEVESAQRLLANAQLKKIAAQLPGVVYQYELRPDGTACFPYASEGIRDIYEVAPQDVVDDATPVVERLHPDDIDTVFESIAVSAEQLTPWELEYRYRRDDGGYRWLLGRATPERLPDGGTLWHGFIYDVTEQCKTRQRLGLALRSGNLGLWDWNVRTGHVYMDPVWHKLLGYDAGDLAPRFETWLEIVHPEDRAQVQARIERHFANPDSAYNVEMRFKLKAGDYRWVESTGEVVERGPDGEPWRMVGVVKDVDDTHRVVNELIDARAAAEDANQAKTHFLANMSHEIRTPMTAILGYADLLTEADVDSDQHLNHAATIKRNGEHLLAIINDILDLSRIEAGKMDVEVLPVDLHALVADVSSLMQVRFDAKKIPLHIDIPQEVPIMLSDPTKLRQMLMNLVGNAVKFTEQGHVAIRLSVSNTTDTRATLRIAVEDTGVGIPADKIESLFEAFTQTDSSHTRRFGGTGLGLNICNRLAGLLGGTMEVDSQPGQGSTFTVVFTDVAVLAEESEKPEAIGPGMGGAVTTDSDISLKGRRILLAEDSPDNQRLIGFFLKKAEAEVVVVENGRLAVAEAERAVKEGRAFDVILMDVQMPELDGNAAVWRLRRTGYNKPIITLSAHAMAEERNKALRSGSDGYLTKPINRDELIAACANAKRRSMAA